MTVPCRDGEVAINGEVVGTLVSTTFEPLPMPVLDVSDLFRVPGDPHTSAYNPVLIVHPSQWEIIKAACVERPGEYAVSLYGCEVYRPHPLPRPSGARRKRARVRRVA